MPIPNLNCRNAVDCHQRRSDILPTANTAPLKWFRTIVEHGTFLRALCNVNDMKPQELRSCTVVKGGMSVNKLYSYLKEVTVEYYRIMLHYFVKVFRGRLTG